MSIFTPLRKFLWLLFRIFFLERRMPKTAADLDASLDLLEKAAADLKARIALLPASPDLTAEVARVDAVAADLGTDLA